MIPTKYAELLSLPPETDPQEARQHCLQLQTELRQQSRAIPPDNPDLPKLEERLGELDQFLNNLADEEVAPDDSQPSQPGGESSGTLPEEIRASLDLGHDATAEEALAKAEARLKETVDAQSALKPKHPAHPKLRRDRQRFETMTAELRQIIFGNNVQRLCDNADEALQAQPPDHAKARDFLRHAHLDAFQLPPESPCVRRLAQLEARLEETEVAPAAPVLNAAPASESNPSPAPTLPPENPFLRLEILLDQGLACLAQDKPDEPAAREFFSGAEAEAAGREVPPNLRNRMQLFKRMLEHVRREAILLQVEQILMQSSAAMAQQPVGIAEARERLAAAECLLKEAPNAYFKSEAARLQRAIEEHEHWLLHRRIEQPLHAGLQSKVAEQPGPRLPQLSVITPAARTTQKIATKSAPVARIAPVRSSVRGTPQPVPESNPEPPVQPVVPVARVKRSRALEVGLALVFIALIAALCAGVRIIKAMSTLTGWIGNLPVAQPASSPTKIAEQPPNASVVAPVASQQELGEVTVVVTPPEAELFTNGISLGHPDYPVFLRGLTGKELKLTAGLNGYSNATKIVTFPTSQFADDETLELQPKPALIIVHSDPPASEVVLHKEHSDPVTLARLDDGVEFTPGVPFELSVQVPDYEPVRTNLAALRPGERKLVDFGKLTVQTAAMHLKVYPPDTQFSIVYLGREPIPYGARTNLPGIIPRVPFELIAEHPGYASVSNSFLLKPRESVNFDLGRLPPLSASLVVTASPEAFDLKVAWDGASKDYGSERRAAGLPSGKNLLVTVSAAGHEMATTNLVLEPGEQKELFFGGLQPAKSYVLLKSDPPGADVTYSIDGHFPIDAGVTDHIDDLPLGHIIKVTLHKAGYVDQLMRHTLLLAGETLDFGHLTPVVDTNVTPKTVRPDKGKAGTNQRNAYNSASIDRLLKEIDAHILVIGNNVPLTETSRREWNEWIDKVTAMNHDNVIVWTKLEAPLRKLREIVNRTSPLPIAPVAKNSP